MWDSPPHPPSPVIRLTTTFNMITFLLFHILLINISNGLELTNPIILMQPQSLITFACDYTDTEFFDYNLCLQNSLVSLSSSDMILLK